MFDFFLEFIISAAWHFGKQSVPVRFIYPSGQIKESIVSNVSDLSAISEENAASSEEVSASIESVSENVTEINNQMSQMEALSEHLTETVSFFS